MGFEVKDSSILEIQNYIDAAVLHQQGTRAETTQVRRAHGVDAASLKQPSFWGNGLNAIQDRITLRYQNQTVILDTMVRDLLAKPFHAQHALEDSSRLVACIQELLSCQQFGVELQHQLFSNGIAGLKYLAGEFQQHIEGHLGSEGIEKAFRPALKQVIQTLSQIAQQAAFEPSSFLENRSKRVQNILVLVNKTVHLDQEALVAQQKTKHAAALEIMTLPYLPTELNERFQALVLPTSTFLFQQAQEILLDVHVESAGQSSDTETIIAMQAQRAQHFVDLLHGFIQNLGRFNEEKNAAVKCFRANLSEACLGQAGLTVIAKEWEALCRENKGTKPLYGLCTKAGSLAIDACFKNQQPGTIFSTLFDDQFFSNKTTFSVQKYAQKQVITRETDASILAMFKEVHLFPATLDLIKDLPLSFWREHSAHIQEFAKNGLFDVLKSKLKALAKEHSSSEEVLAVARDKLNQLQFTKSDAECLWVEFLQQHQSVLPALTSSELTRFIAATSSLQVKRHLTEVLLAQDMNLDRLIGFSENVDAEVWSRAVHTKLLAQLANKTIVRILNPD